MSDKLKLRYIRFAIVFILIAMFFVNTNNNNIYAQYDDSSVFKKTGNPFQFTDQTDPIMFMSTEDIDDNFDPARCYANDSLKIIGSTYEPPLSYHYLKRPYELIPLTAKRIPEPIYSREIKDKNGRLRYEKCTLDQLYDAISKSDYIEHTILPKNSDEDQSADDDKITGQIKITYRIEITPGIYYSPHPCFAQDKDGYLYHKGKGKGRSLSDDLIDSIDALEDFEYYSTRELVASDYVYGIRRLFNPGVRCPILETFLTKYIAGGYDFTQTLSKAYKTDTEGEEEDEDEWNGYGYYGNPVVVLPYCEYEFEGVKEIDKYTFEINLFRPYTNFNYWLAMYFFSPIPWEADLFYDETQSANGKTFSFTTHPIGTGPYAMRSYSRYSGRWSRDSFPGDYPIYNSRYFRSFKVNPYFNRLTENDGKKPPIYNTETGYGVDKNNNGVVDGDELPFYDLNNNKKYDGLENGEGFYFEDLNNNKKHDENELWYTLPASYRTVYPDDGVPNTTEADLRMLNNIRVSQKLNLDQNKMEQYSEKQEEAEKEIENLEQNGVDITKIGDYALGNLLDAGHRLPITNLIVQGRFYSNAYVLSYIANGFIDIFEPADDFETSMLESYSKEVRLKNKWSETGLKLISEPRLSTSYWGINMMDKQIGWNNYDSPRASDSLRKIRQAIAIAVDMEDWARKFGLGMEVSQSFSPAGLFTQDQLDKIKPNNWVYEPNNSGGLRRRSIDEAKQLMKEAGWEDGKNPDGVQLTIEIDGNRFEDNEDEADWFQRQFAKLGIRVKTDKSYSSYELIYGKYQMFHNGWNADYPDPENFALLFYGPNHRSFVGTSWGGINENNYMNPAFDELYEQLVRTTDPDEKLEILQKLNEIIYFDAPVLGFLTPKENVTRYPWVMNHKIHVIVGRSMIYQRIDTVRRKKMQNAIAQLYD